MPSQSSLTTRFYKRKITASDGTDITGDTVKWAFMPWRGDKPADGDFHTAAYTSANVWQVLVGPGDGGLTLAIGTYGVWEKVTDSPEIEAELVDVLEIT